MEQINIINEERQTFIRSLAYYAVDCLDTSINTAESMRKLKVALASLNPIEKQFYSDYFEIFSQKEDNQYSNVIKK